MKRILIASLRLLAARVLPMWMMLFFLLIYVGLAFFNAEPLSTLILLFRDYPPLAMILALIPLNSAIRLGKLSLEFIRLRGALAGRSGEQPVHGLFEEAVTLPGNVNFRELKQRLDSFGYRTRLTDVSLSAYRGITLFPARAFILAASCCLFAGVLVSTTMRSTQRVSVIEGEPFPLPKTDGGRVEKIVLADKKGLIFSRTLAIEVAGLNDRTKVFGIYPPSLHEGSFVYPRYLGGAPLVRFSAPDLPQGFEMYYILMIYPPGKEDSASIPGTDYRIIFSMLTPETGDDPFQSGNVTLLFKIMKKDLPVSSGQLALGSEFKEQGYRLSFLDFRRVAASDLIKDRGVIMIWISLFLLVSGMLCWLPVRLLSPRREMLFFDRSGVILACSRAEGHRTQHAGIFNDALDLLAPGHSS